MNLEENDWRVYKGSGSPAAAPVKFPVPPGWRVPGEARAKVLASTFQPHPGLIDAVNASIYLRRPLLITGKPGSGKSSLIYSVASELGLGKVLTWPVNSRSTLKEAQYTYDALGRLQRIQERQAKGAPIADLTSGDISADTSDDTSEIGLFFTLGPLGTALASTSGRRALLVDEIDKSDVDLPNDLLNVLDTGYFEISELRRLGTVKTWIADAEGASVEVTAGKVVFTEFPFVVMTSNGERDFPAPFLRRCVQFELPDPEEEDLRRIVLAHFGKLTKDDPDLTAKEGLLAKFIAKRKELPLSTDQLLNAVQVLRNSDVTFSDAEKEKLLTTLFQKLG
jgi:MoxR-like ATPase